MNARCVCLFVGLLPGLLLAQDERPQRVQKKRETPAALRPIQDEAGLPRVLLIGDSISIGYTLDVRERLRGVANVHRIPTNGGPTSNGVANLDAWLGDKPWDVIHFNWGLHDLKYVDEQGGLVDPEGGKPQISPAEYEKNLRQLVQRLKRTGAKLIWCSTTPVPAGAQGRIAGSEAGYNAIAAQVMQEEGVRTNDLCTFAATRLQEIQRPANVHFTSEGSQQLSEPVAAAIRAALRE